MKRVLPLAILLLLAGGCVPESVRQTNRLNADAARWIAETAPDAGVDRAARTIADGSAVIERTLGAPETPISYTPEAHEATVKRADADAAAQQAVGAAISGWVEETVKTVANYVLPGAGGLLVGLWAWLRTSRALQTVKQGAAVIVNAVEKLPEAKLAVSAAASRVGASAVVDSLVQALKR